MDKVSVLRSRREKFEEYINKVYEMTKLDKHAEAKKLVCRLFALIENFKKQ
jgi:hypothetical protein